ncbi:hypothetical protein SMC26_00295 [Actinomadura fulvescens]|uniref:Uncharacterized protein n=1 Tax=Actinomadura fulvescens TaxID=46160 RepID=A0ABN3PQ99_9ACTN
MATGSARPGRAGSRRFGAGSLLVALLGMFLLYLAVPNLRPVMKSARAGTGVPGTFTAERLNCVNHPGHTACGWEGGFLSDDGTRVKTQVSLYGGAGDLVQGGRTRARDVGRSGQVYRYAGTREWIFTGGLGVAGLALLALPVLPVLHRMVGGSGARPRTGDTSRPRVPHPSAPPAERRPR